MQGLIEPEGEDEGIVVNAWSAAALGGRMETRQTGQQCCDESVDSGKRQFIWRRSSCGNISNLSPWLVGRGILSLPMNAGV